MAKLVPGAATIGDRQYRDIIGTQKVPLRSPGRNFRIWTSCSLRDLWQILAALDHGAGIFAAQAPNGLVANSTALLRDELAD